MCFFLIYDTIMGIKEIAALAKVSKSTVSLALNGHKGIGTETRRRIIQIANDLNYKGPGNRLDTTETNSVIMFARLKKHGLLLNNDQSPFIIDYIDGINSVIQDCKYVFEILDFQYDKIDAFIDAMHEKEPSGIIILGTELDAKDVLSFEKLSIPYIIIDTYFDYIPCDYVNMSNVGAVYKIISYLHEKKHTNISMVTSTITSSNILMREKGFKEAMDYFSLPYNEHSFIRVQPGFHGAYQDMKKYLATRNHLPSSLFCYNDVASYGVMKALRESGIKIPKDISIVGFDDLPMSTMMEPHLTTIRVPTTQLGKIATQKIIEKIERTTYLSPTATLICGQLVERESVIARD